MDWGEPKERQIRAWGGEQTGSAGLVTLERGGSRDGRGEGEWAEMQDREGGREGVAGAAPPAQALEPPPRRDVPTCSSPALTSFSLPGANGFPCCGKESVDIVETQ